MLNVADSINTWLENEYKLSGMILKPSDSTA